MTMNKVVFLGEDYNIPEEIHAYVQLLHQFEGYQTTLRQELEKQKQKNDWEDFGTWQSILTPIIESVVIALSKYQIFNVSKGDLLTDNIGLSQFKETCGNTCENLVNIKKKELEAFMTGYTHARAKANSQITGSGVSIWTNSMTTALVHTALEARTLQKQAENANENFRRELDSISISSEWESRMAQIKLLDSYYYPCIEMSISVFIGGLFQKFIQALSDAGKFNSEVISQYDKNKSNDILGNLKLISDKRSVIREAFSCCPYNAAVYTSLVTEEIWDKESFDVAKKIGCDSSITHIITEYCEKHIDKAQRLSIPVAILSNYKNCEEKVIWKQLYASQIKEVENKYKILHKLISPLGDISGWVNVNISASLDSLLNMSEDSIEKKIDEYMEKIVIQTELDMLVNNGLISVQDLVFSDIQVETYKELNYRYSTAIKNRINDYIMKSKEDIYLTATKKFDSTSLADVKRAKVLFESILSWKDADEFRNKCIEKIQKLELEEKERVVIAQKLAEQQAQKRKILMVGIGVLVVLSIVLYNVLMNH